MTKTSELTGDALCYCVTMIEHPDLVWGESIGMHHASDQIVVPNMVEPQCYSPYTDWGMCGPIIERESIALDNFIDYPKWYAGHPNQYIGFGPTPLIAAMRCYIASKLGDDVELPEELK